MRADAANSVLREQASKTFAIRRNGLGACPFLPPKQCPGKLGPSQCAQRVGWQRVG